MISLHFTQPAAEVVPSNGAQIFDIETLEQEDLDYKVSLEIAQTSKISISYDINKLDEIEAGKFLQLVKFYLDDPDMMLL